MLFPSDTLLHIALISEIWSTTIHCRPVGLATPDRRGRPTGNNSSLINDRQFDPYSNQSTNSTVRGDVGGEGGYGEREWRTFYTPENVSLLLEALLGDRRGDWRAGMDQPVIIWSHESQYHPDFGKYNPGTITRESLTSRYMSFFILGVVIAFIVYAYLNHLFAVRVAHQTTRKEERFRQLLEQSALIMATSANSPDLRIFDDSGKRISILSLFHAFRL